MTLVRAVVAAQDMLGETPLWCTATRRLWWLDVDRPAVQRLDPQTGRHDVFVLAGVGAVGSLALRRAGGLLIGRDRTLQLFDPDTGVLRPFASVEPDALDVRLNDGRCDAAGRFWVGSLDNALHRPIASVYRVDPDGTVTRQFDDVIVTNSIAIAPDQRTFYVSDTRRFVHWAFDLDPAGVLSNRRVFVDHRTTGDRPDGACVDAEGHVWTAIFAGSRVVRYRPDGTIARTIALPVTNPTCVCLGGDDLRTLYITSARKFLSPAQRAAEPLAGAVLAVPVEVPGLPEARFGG